LTLRNIGLNRKWPAILSVKWYNTQMNMGKKLIRAGDAGCAVVMYRVGKGKRIEVKLERDTVWLSQAQIAMLFSTERSVVTKHVSNILRDKELERNSVCAKIAHTAADGKTYKTAFYNLDMIISIGYRVNSRRATQFRIWATQVLKAYLVKGYSLNQKLLTRQAKKYEALQKSLKLLNNVLDSRALPDNEAKGLLEIIVDYAYALDILDDYDHGCLSAPKRLKKTARHLEYFDAVKIIAELKKKFSCPDIFGQERDQSFKSSLAAIYQTFDGKELYPSLEEKAASLLYFVVKDHSFVDGNKRIAAALFLCFLDINGLLYNEDGSKRVVDSVLVALTLMIAQSRPLDKADMITVTMRLLSRSLEK